MSSELNALEKARALGDFYWFSKHVFGNADMQEKTHKELCDKLQVAHRRKSRGLTTGLFLMPRGTFKSSIASQAYPLWRALSNPNIRVLITNEKLENSKGFLGSIKSCIEENEYFSELFGDLKTNEKTGAPVRWNQESVTIPQRTRQQLREPTFSASSVSTTKVSQHYDLIIADDLVSEKTVSTIEQVQKTLKYYRSLQSLLEPGGLLVVIGTRYSYDDLYGHLIENSIPDFMMVKKAELEDGSMFFPEFETVNAAGEVVIKGHSHATLEQIKKIQGPYMYGCQYMNEPTNADTAVFDETDFRYIGRGKEELLVPAYVSRFLLVDPARSTAQDADYSGLVIVALDSDHNIFVEYTHQERMVPSALIDLIFDLHKKYQFAKIGVEQVAMQNMVDWILDRAKMKGCTYLPVVPVKTATNVSKEQRIRSLEPLYKQHRIYHAKNLFDLENQLIRFPNIVHDDVIDALSMMNRVAYAPTKLPEQEPLPPDDVVVIDYEALNMGNKSPDNWEDWDDEDGLLLI